MRHSHLETFAPVCPACRRRDESLSPIRVQHVSREEAGDLLEGTLVCTNAGCLGEFPVIDGLPVLVPNVREYVAAHAFALLARRDLGPVVESLLGDCCGPGSEFDTLRQQIGNYAADHYADWSADATRSETPSAGVVGLARTLWESAEPATPALDLGCGLGRTTFELADRTGGPVLGIDTHAAMLRVATDLLRSGGTSVPRRRVGLVYDRVEVERRSARPELVDFWIADATALPVPPSRSGSVVCLNLLDCVADPLRLLEEVRRGLAAGGTATIACPYDWSPGATALEGWLGGHSQRSRHGGAGESLVRDLLTPGALPRSLDGVEIVAEFDRLPWEVRLHDRGTMRYDVHAFVVRRTDA